MDRWRKEEAKHQHGHKERLHSYTQTTSSCPCVENCLHQETRQGKGANGPRTKRHTRPPQCRPRAALLQTNQNPDLPGTRRTAAAGTALTTAAPETTQEHLLPIPRSTQKLDRRWVTWALESQSTEDASTDKRPNKNRTPHSSTSRISLPSDTLAAQSKNYTVSALHIFRAREAETTDHHEHPYTAYS